MAKIEAGKLYFKPEPIDLARTLGELEDDGVGIKVMDIDRLFGEFQQLDSGTAKRHAGTGLGLALTKRIVEAQGGCVGVASDPGKGSVFYAVLSRVLVVDNVKTPAHPRRMSSTHTRGGNNG